ncbi:MAG: GNAT family N-acetyltransferase [Ilumatobacteraceae bacterium]
MTSTPTRMLAAPAVTIRTATLADWPAVRSVIAAAYHQYEAVLAPTVYRDYLADLLDTGRHAEAATILVAEADGTVVGTVCLYLEASRTGMNWSTGTAAVRALAVEPGHRGRGTARRLMDECIARAIDAGASTVGLHTASVMTAAVQLYERIGFVRDPARDIDAAQLLGLADVEGPRVIAYRLDVTHPIDAYALGRSAAETRRLILQHQIYGPITTGVLTAAGITRGMRVLDLGSGAGDVALALAQLVGPEGRVVGVDANDAILDTARSRVTASGWTNVELRRGDIRRLDLDGPFDAVVGRWILMYLPDPAAVIRQASHLLRPGGIVAFIESGDLTAPLRTHPSMPVHEDVIRWMTPPPDTPMATPTTDMGMRLHRTFRDAGLPAPQLRHEAPIGGGEAWPGFTYVAESVRSLLPMLVQLGSVTAAEADVDTLADRLRAEAVAADGVQVLPTVVGAWSRTA